MPASPHAPTVPPPPARVLRPDEGGAQRLVADVVTTKLTAAETGGAHSLVETATEPGGGTAPHVRHGEDATFVVLDGVYAFVVDGARHEVGAGGVVFAPRGTVHAYTNPGPAVARMLVVATPGGVHERFLAEAGAPVTGGPSGPGGGPPDLRALARAAARHGIEVRGDKG